LAAFAAASVYWGSYIASLPDLKATAGLSDARFGLLLTMTTVGGIISMQALGRVLHRVQAYAIPVAFAGFAAGMLLMAYNVWKTIAAGKAVDDARIPQAVAA
jgi:cbb3-type cytochrome oxidase subunit 1